MITFENVSFNYKNCKEIISDLSFSVNNGEKIALVGASGSGKTTLLRLVMGLEKAKKGKITISENTRFSVVFQEDRLIPHKTALENIALFSDDQTAKELLLELGLGKDLNSLPAELSGGMKRRVALARALARESEVLILDEAFNGIDEQTKELCFNAIEKHAKNRTIFAVSHSKDETARLCTREIRL